MSLFSKKVECSFKHLYHSFISFIDQFNYGFHLEILVEQTVGSKGQKSEISSEMA